MVVQITELQTLQRFLDACNILDYMRSRSKNTILLLGNRSFHCCSTLSEFRAKFSEMSSGRKSLHHSLLSGNTYIAVQTEQACCGGQTKTHPSCPVVSKARLDEVLSNLI